MAVEQTVDDRTAPNRAVMKWRAASRKFVSGRGGVELGSPLDLSSGAGWPRGKKYAACRCGKTIEAQPVSGQTCLIEPADALPETLTRRDRPMAFRCVCPGARMASCAMPDLHRRRCTLLLGEKSLSKLWPPCPLRPARYRCAREPQRRGSIRQQAKPFILECKPTHKPKSDAQKTSVWGRLDADIAQGLKDERDDDHAAVTVCSDGT